MLNNQMESPESLQIQKLLLSLSLEEKIVYIKKIKTRLSKLLRFIDKNIPISIEFADNNGEITPKLDYYKEKGILIYINELDYNEENVKVTKLDSPFEKKAIKYIQKQRVRRGEEVYLTRTDFIIMNRDGKETPDLLHKFHDQNISLINPHSISVKDLVESYEDFFESFLFSIKEYILEAIKENPKKLPILQNFIDYIKDLEEEIEKHENIIEKLQEDPENPELLMKYAIFLDFKKKNIDEATKYYEKAYELDPKNPETILPLSRFYFNNRYKPDYYEKGINVLKKGLKNNPNNPEIIFRLAETWMYKKREIPVKADNFVPDPDEVEKITKYYNKAIELNPKEADYHNSFSLFLFWFGRHYDLVLEECKKSLELSNGSINNYANYSGVMQLIYLDLQKYPERESQISTKITLEKVESVYMEMVRKHPNEEISYMLYHFFLKENIGDFDAAERQIKKAVETGTDNAWVYYHYARFLIDNKDDLVSAEKNIKIALNLVPESRRDDFMMSGFLVSLLLLNGKLDEGLKELNNSIEMFKEKKEKKSVHWYNSRIGLYFLKYLYTIDRDLRMNLLKNMKKLIILRNEVEKIQGGFSRGFWLFKKHIKKAKINKHPDFKILNSLKNVIEAKREIKSLERFEIWKNL
jgi:tetratricopeptide (TPR) repeat protein